MREFLLALVLAASFLVPSPAFLPPHPAHSPAHASTHSSRCVPLPPLYSAPKDDPPGPPSPDGEDRLGKQLLKNFAKLSLLDYKWRRDLFTRASASRSESQALSRMTGSTQKMKPMFRPMDLSDSESELGPLGIAESKAVAWLEQVMDSEAERARKIVEGDGDPVRPAKDPSSPLGRIEKGTVEFVESVVQSERARAEFSKEYAGEKAFGAFLPPSSLPEGKRGPLGEAENAAKTLLNDIKEAETIRAQLGKAGDERRVVRPLDVGGPLGEAERIVSDIQIAEKKRAQEKSTSGTFVRPMDASVKGPLGEAEEGLVTLVESLKHEERKRYENLVENRPMNTDRKSVTGALESVSVGIIRAPVMLVKIATRVRELLRNEREGEGGEDEAEGRYEREPEEALLDE